MNKHTVVIPTCGLGSRMNSVNNILNKALLPFHNKPILSHIIEKFPDDTRFIILMGYSADQIRDYCGLTYKNKNIEYVNVDDWSSDKAGPGYSMTKCESMIDGDFWYIPCDTYFDENILDVDRTKDCIFVTNPPHGMSQHYTMFDVQNGVIVNTKFKESVTDDWVAFTGVMYIKEYLSFFVRLISRDSPEIIWAIHPNSTCRNLDSWLDFGNAKIYQDALSRSQKYDFTKTNEITYQCNNRIIKWWKDGSIAKKKYLKASSNPNVYPIEIEHRNNWLAYTQFDGCTLYEKNDVTIFPSLLQWLKSEVWKHNEIDLHNAATLFYKAKTLNRIDQFLEKYPDLPNVTHVNSVPVQSWEYYFNKLPWGTLENDLLPSHIHGDLQFDNLIVSPDGDFKLIDWRQEFGGVVEYGDIYYDLAKMIGGFIINYKDIKDNQFTFDMVDNKVFITFPGIDNADRYILEIKDFIRGHGWSVDKVQLLIPLIFWSMAPLHTPPFDKLLWYLGIKLFADIGL